MMQYTCGASRMENGGHIFVSLCCNLLYTIWRSEQCYIHKHPHQMEKVSVLDKIIETALIMVLYLLLAMSVQSIWRKRWRSGSACAALRSHWAKGIVQGTRS